MTFEVADGVFTISNDMIMTAALASILLLIGFWIKKKVPALTKYCIPAPVIGGFLFMFITFAGHQTGAFAFNFNTTLQSPFMVAFFTTVGLGASISLLKKGGMLLVIYWLRLCTFNVGGLGLIPDQEARSHMPQLRVCMLPPKILHAATKMGDPICRN